MNGMFPRQVWRERHPCVPRVNTIIPTFPFIRSTPTERYDLEKCLWRRHDTRACMRVHVYAFIARPPSPLDFFFFIFHALANPPRGYLKGDSSLGCWSSPANLDSLIAPALVVFVVKNFWESENRLRSICYSFFEIFPSLEDIAIKNVIRQVTEEQF